MTTPAVEALPTKRASTIALRDLVALTKPRITALVLTTTTGGLWLAPAKMPRLELSLALLGTSLVVGGANALNMYSEQDVDAKMARTKNRPLPAGRLSPRVALWFGVALSALSVPILAIGVNAATALLAVLAHVSYVLAYTPMKRRTHIALLVGAVPGAIPPLLGWTAATGKVELGGLVLFGILYFWQIPHFLAIAIFRRDDYARAGLKVMPVELGMRATKHAIVRYLVALVGVSLLLVPLGLGHRLYLASASVLGAAFFATGCYGLRKDAGDRWARWLFVVSLVYLVLLFVAIALSAGA